MAYLVADVLILFVWLILFNRRNDLRKEMLTMSILGLPIALFDFFYVPTYWIPTTLFNIPVGIEGFIFSFLCSGIAAVVYAEVAHVKLVKIAKYHKHTSLLVLLIIVPVAVLFSYFYPINIAVSMYVALLVGISLTLFLRKDLVKSTIKGSLIFGTLYAALLLIWSSLLPETQNWFITTNLPRIFIIHASLYEIIFGYIFGAYWGNLYELFFGYKFKNQK
jgi:hypothetical protein